MQPLSMCDRTHNHAPRSLQALLPLSLLFLAGCSLDATESPVEVRWVADDIVAFPSEDELVEEPWQAEAQMVTGGGETTISVQVVNAEPGDVLAWETRTGSCVGSGFLVSANPDDFPPLEVNAFGEAVAIAIFIGTIDTTDSYAVEFFDPDDEARITLACGDLIRQD
jgi:hypothetical protein